MAKNEFIDKLKIHGNIFVDKDGCLNIIGLKGIMFPLPNFAAFIRILEERCNKKEVMDAFFYAGKIQTIFATNLIVKKYGFKDKLKAISIVLDEGQMIGLGKFELIKYDVNNLYFIITNKQSPLAKQIRLLFGKQKEAVDHFSRGCLSGIFDILFKNEFIAIEENCIAKGNNQCLFKLRTRKSWEKITLTSELKKQMPIAEMNYKNIARLKNPRFFLRA